MTMTEINAMSTETKETRIVELKKELLNLRFQLAAGNLNDDSQLKKIKQDVARLKTSLNSK